MKFLKKNWFYLVIIIIIALYIQERFNNAGRYNKKVKRIESEKAKIKEVLQVEIEEHNKLYQEKQQIVTRYNALKVSLKAKIKPLERVKTIYIDKVKYVTKLKYRQLWDFSLNIKTNFDKYIEKDKEDDLITSNIITNYKNLNLKNEQIQTEYLQDISKLRSKVRRRFNISVGAGIVTGLDGNLKLGFGLFLGYRIL